MRELKASEVAEISGGMLYGFIGGLIGLSIGYQLDLDAGRVLHPSVISDTMEIYRDLGTKFGNTLEKLYADSPFDPQNMVDGINKIKQSFKELTV